MGTNNGNVGKKGISGRKSKYQELADAQFLHKVFLKTKSPEEFKKLLKKGKYSVKDVWLAKLLAGNERFIQQLVNKLFPDGLKLSGDKDNPVEFALNDKAKKIIEEASEKLRATLEEEI